MADRQKTRRIISCASCGEIRPHSARGLCYSCYYKRRRRRLVECAECGEIKPRESKGLCSACYKRSRRRLVKCIECGEIRPHAAKGLCDTCYKRRRRRKLVECAECGEIKPLQAKGLCDTCYKRRRKLVECAECGEIKPHAAKGLCDTCYQRTFYPFCRVCGERRTASADKVCPRCSRRLRAEARLAEAMEGRPPAGGPFTYGPCPECGAVVMLPPGHRYCSTRCANRRSSRDARHRRRRRGGTSSSPKPLAVLRRESADLCRLCSRPIVDRPGDGFNPLGPSVDHVVPLSVGGTHDADNVVLAHVICNTMKGDKTPDEWVEWAMAAEWDPYEWALLWSLGLSWQDDGWIIPQSSLEDQTALT